MNMESPELNNKPEGIKESVIRFKGEIFTGNLHIDALNKLKQKYPNWTEMASAGERIEEGFLTATGRFVDRYEAQKIVQPELEEKLRQAMDKFEKLPNRE